MAHRWTHNEDRRLADRSDTDLAPGAPAAPAEPVRPVDPEEQVRTRIAWYYYFEGQTQAAIAQRLGMSRVRVNRILAQCREEGLVQIRINSKLTSCVARERALERAFGLSEAVVVPSPSDDADVPAVLGAAAGAYVSDILADHQSIGVGWGRTLYHSLRSVRRRPLKGLSVVSLLGGLTRASAMNTYETAARFADLFGADCYYIAAPAFTDTEASRDMLLQQEVLQEVFDKARRVDIAVISVGDATTDSTIHRLGLITRTEVAELQALGAVGDLLGHYLDADGNLVDHSLNARVMALSPRDLDKVGKAVLVSGGRSKVPAVRASLKGGYADALITDENTAEALLGEGDPGVPGG
jgi:DNA-binding transcriptional regulator LsrR (DeoR family)